MATVQVSTAQCERRDLGDCVYRVSTVQCQRHRSGMYTEETLGTVFAGWLLLSVKGIEVTRVQQRP